MMRKLWHGSPLAEFSAASGHTLEPFAFPAPMITAGGMIELAPDTPLQSAIDELSVRGGGTVYLRAGTYRLNEPLKMRSGIVLQGERQDRTVLLLASEAGHSAAAVMTNSQPLRDAAIRDLTIDAGLSRAERSWTNGRDEAALAPPLGIWFTDIGGVVNERIALERLYVTRSRLGVHLKGTNDVVISESAFIDNGSGTGYMHNGYLRRNERVIIRHSKFCDSPSSNGLNLTTQTHLIVHDCVFSGNFNRGIRVADSTYVILERNRSTRNGQHGIILNCEGRGVSHFVLSGNRSEGNGEDDLLAFASYGAVLADNTWQNGEITLSDSDSIWLRQPGETSQ